MAGSEVHRLLAEAQDLLNSQKEGAWTYRAVDCLAQPVTCLKSWALGFGCWWLHSQNRKELKTRGDRNWKSTICPCGAVKATYRHENFIPGLDSDDCCASTCCCCCVIAQVHNELEEQQKEKHRLDKITQSLKSGMEMDRY